MNFRADTKYSSNILNIDISQRIKLIEAGHAIVNFVNEAVKKNDNVKYLLILEGQSSKDDYPENYELSYKRALDLVKYWSDNEIYFDGNTCEVIISGSDHASPYRVQPDINGNKNNQRFVIHVISKIGDIK